MRAGCAQGRGTVATGCELGVDWVAMSAARRFQRALTSSSGALSRAASTSLPSGARRRRRGVRRVLRRGPQRGIRSGCACGSTDGGRPEPPTSQRSGALPPCCALLAAAVVRCPTATWTAGRSTSGPERGWWLGVTIGPGPGRMSLWGFMKGGELGRGVHHPYTGQQGRSHSPWRLRWRRRPSRRRPAAWTPPSAAAAAAAAERRRRRRRLALAWGG